MHLWDELDESIQIIKPVGYLDMLLLEKNARKILTDSGGVQKEAYMLQTPCITMRDETEWVETVDDGWNQLVGTNKNKIIDAAREFEPKRRQRDVFGTGNASRKMIDLIIYSSKDLGANCDNAITKRR